MANPYAANHPLVKAGLIDSSGTYLIGSKKGQNIDPSVVAPPQGLGSSLVVAPPVVAPPVVAPPPQTPTASNPYADALSKSVATSTGISGGIMRHFLDTMQPTSQADALAKLENFQAPGGNQGIKGLLQNQFAKPEYSLEGIQSLNQARDASAAAYEAKRALGWGKGDFATFSDKPLWETYGFATPGAEYVRLGQFNAKNMPFASPGVGIANRGATRENIFPMLNDLYDQWGQYEGAGFEGGNKMGGNKSNWDALKYWNTGDKPESATSMASPYGSKDALQTYLTTGQITPELTPEYALEALDYAERETARRQQRKPGSILQQVGGGISAIGGPILQVAGAATGNTGLYAAGTALKSGGKLARGQGFGSVLADAGVDWLASGAPFPGSTTLGPMGRGALTGGITAARGGNLNESLLAGTSGYYGGQDYGSVNLKNLTLQKATELAGQGLGQAAKRIGTTIGINYLAPPKEPPTYDYPDPTTNAAVAAQNAAASTLGNANQTIGQNAGISTLGNANQTIGQNTGISTLGTSNQTPYIDPVTFRGIGALGPDFMNVYERAARGLA